MGNKKYPETSSKCKEDFINDGWELICGKMNQDGDWILCKECSKLSKNKNFKKVINYK